MIQKLLDLDFYQRNFLKIVTKSGQLEAFHANLYQKKLNELAKNRDKPLRLLILKCRQIGASTWASSFIYHRTATQHNKTSLIVADDDSNTSGLFNMSKGFYENSPDMVKPMRRYSNARALTFDSVYDDENVKGLGSNMLVATAGKMSAGRSKTIQYLHCSEFAFWPNAAKVATGLFQAVPLLPNTAIIIESTANGVGGQGAQFYELCNRALDGDSAFDFCFFDWTDNPEYEIGPAENFKLTDEEKDLMARFPKLTLQKVAFRRYKIENEMGSAIIDPRDQFNQEYPLTPHHAFISSGRPVFSAESIHAALAKCPEPKRYALKGESFVEDDRGEFLVFKKPEQRGYAIGADVAEGIEGGDLSSACVMDKSMDVSCVYAGKIDPDKFGALLVALGKWYNGATLCVESNNHGYATLAAIKNLGYYYVFKREVQEELGKELQEKVGWQTNVKTKMLMLDELVAAFRDNVLKVNCKATLKEMMTLSVEGNGSVELNGKDRTVAIGLAIQGLKQVVDKTFQAFVPNKSKTKDVTKMSLSEKLAYYKRMGS